MKKLGTIFIYVGTIAGLTAAARIPPHYDYFWASLGILLVGIFFKMLFTRKGSRVQHALSLEDLRNPLLGAFREIQSLQASREVINLKNLHERIDRVVNDYLYSFGINSSSMKSMFGISGYNSVMMHYALGERYVNRVWSASADGYQEEAFDYLEKSEPEFREALATIDRLHEAQRI